MSGLSIPARRYILGLMAIGTMVSTWELSHLPDQSRWILFFLIPLAIATFVFKQDDPDERASRRLAFTLAAVGAALVGRHLPRLTAENAWVLPGMGALAAAAHIWKQPGPTIRSSYQLSFTVYGFSVAALGAPATVLIVIISHVLEYAWGTYYLWYIQAFNVATFVLSASVAGIFIGSTKLATRISDASSVLAIVAANVVFVLLNHILIGIALKMARGQSFKESGVFGFLTLMIDFSLLCMGAVTAMLWQFYPYAIFLALIPLYLVYTTLRVPALERQTETDPKTGIYNASYFNKTFRQELVRANRFNRPLTLVMADLDLLRKVNNRYGHLAGDVVLNGVAQTLHNLAGDYDVVARFGGEEFAILMPESTAEVASVVVESMRQAIANAEFQTSTSDSPILVTMSFGIADRQHAGESADDLIHRADMALLQAKRDGRNRVVLSSPIRSPKSQLQ